MSFDPNERLTEWVDGRMSPRDLARFEAEMAANPGLRARAIEYRQAVEAVREALDEPLAADDAAPGLEGAALTDRIMAAVQSGQRPAATGRRWGPILLSLAAAATIVGGAFVIEQMGASPPPMTEHAAARSDRAGRPGEGLSSRQDLSSRFEKAREVGALADDEAAEQLDALEHKLEDEQVARADADGAAGSIEAESSARKLAEAVPPARRPGSAQADGGEGAFRERGLPESVRLEPDPSADPAQPQPGRSSAAPADRESANRSIATGEESRAWAGGRDARRDAPQSPNGAEPPEPKLARSPDVGAARARRGAPGPTNPAPKAAPGEEGFRRDRAAFELGQPSASESDAETEGGVDTELEPHSRMIVVTLPAPPKRVPDALAQEVLRTATPNEAWVAGVAPLNLDFVSAPGQGMATSTLVEAGPLAGYLSVHGVLGASEVPSLRAFRAQGSVRSVVGLVEGLRTWATDHGADIQPTSVPKRLLDGLRPIPSAEAMLGYLAGLEARRQSSEDPVVMDMEPNVGVEQRRAGDAEPEPPSAADKSSDAGSPTGMSLLVVFRTASAESTAPAVPAADPRGSAPAGSGEARSQPDTPGNQEPPKADPTEPGGGKTSGAGARTPSRPGTGGGGRGGR